MFSFLTVNNFIEHNIQKEFEPNLFGTLEHTAQMASIINKALNSARLSSPYWILRMLLVKFIII